MQNDSVKFKNEFKQRLYKWVVRLIKFINFLDKRSIHDVMGKQLLRSGTSVLANYIEARSASSKKDFINFFTYALKSANESKVWIALLRDTGHMHTQELNILLKELTEISNILASSILTLKDRK